MMSTSNASSPLGSPFRSGVAAIAAVAAIAVAVPAAAQAPPGLAAAPPRDAPPHAAPPQAAPPPAAPPQAARRLTLDEALRLARDQSEAITIAQAAEARADADHVRARSQRLPQFSASSSYDRTLASEFSSAIDRSGPVCAPLSVDPAEPLAARVSELERAAQCGALGPTFDFANLPFGQKNVYRVNVSFSQLVWAGGRVGALERQALGSRDAAVLGTSSAEASVALDVTRAFYDAALADQLVAIAQSGLDQATAAYDQTRLAFEAGRQPEFELLRAQVARDNQRPVLIRRQADRDIAYLRLRQLLDLPPGTPLDLVANLDADDLAPPEPFAAGLDRAAEVDPDARASVRQAAALVQVREAGVDVARAARLPNVSVTSSFGEVGYPSSGVFPSFGDFRTNWTLGASVQVPVFTGRRLKGDELAAQSDLAEAQARLQQARELAELDAATARQDLAAAQAVWEASAGTIEQAARAYQIAELRFREGLSTQLELSDSRFSLQQAQANRAQAARDLQVARARVALLPNLPAGAR
ncbi:MAG: TolC family protein [Vicinamibacterales bacterium]